MDQSVVILRIVSSVGSQQWVASRTTTGSLPHHSQVVTGCWVKHGISFSHIVLCVHDPCLREECRRYFLVDMRRPFGVFLVPIVLRCLCSLVGHCPPWFWPDRSQSWGMLISSQSSVHRPRSSLLKEFCCRRRCDRRCAPSMLSRFVVVCVFTSMYFRCIGHENSFGTCSRPRGAAECWYGIDKRPAPEVVPVLRCFEFNSTRCWWDVAGCFEVALRLRLFFLLLPVTEIEGRVLLNVFSEYDDSHFLRPQPFDVNLCGCVMFNAFPVRDQQVTCPSASRSKADPSDDVQEHVLCNFDEDDVCPDGFVIYLSSKR